MISSSIDNHRESGIHTLQTSQSLIEKHSDTLIRLLGWRNMHHVRELPGETFNPVLWKQLYLFGEPSKYHGLIVNEELQRGYIWVQENCVQKISILWSSKKRDIFRAFFTDKKNITVVFETYSYHMLTGVRNTSSEGTTKDLRRVVNDYLDKCPIPKEVTEQSPLCWQFQRKLELFPIVCKVTRSACKKFVRMSEENRLLPHDKPIVLGYKIKGGDDLVKISTLFLRGRLICLHIKDGKPDITTEPVAPVIRSMKACGDVSKLRGQNLKGEEEVDGLQDFECERTVKKILSDDLVEGKSLKDLHAWFLMSSKGGHETLEFEKLDAKRSDRDSLELSIDFQDDAWELKSQFFGKV